LVGLIAVEHTIIESYSSQIEESIALRSIFPLGGPKLEEVDDAGHFVARQQHGTT
jgi:hypothetical protein